MRYQQLMYVDRCLCLAQHNLHAAAASSKQCVQCKLGAQVTKIASLLWHALCDSYAHDSTSNLQMLF